MSKTKPPLTELRDADISRVDAVKGAANGTRFLIAKAAAGEAGIVSPAEVRELIADPPAPTSDTYLGEAGEVVKAELSTAARNDLPDSKFAYVDPEGVGHFPINDAAHVRNALARLSSSPYEAKARPAVEAAARRMGIGEPAQVGKAKPPFPGAKAPFGKKKVKKMVAPAIADARAVLRKDKLERKARKLEKRTLIAQANQLVSKSGLLRDLGDAHEAVLEAIKDCADDPNADTSTLEALAGKIAGMMSDHAAGNDKPDADEGDGGGEAEVAKGPVSLKKARAMAKAAKLQKRTARDELAASKARRTLAKIGRRNSATDQGHVDAIDEHAAALGASAHQPGTTGVTVSADIAKATETQVEGAVELIMKAVGPLLEKDRAEITEQLTEVSRQLAKVSQIALPGGPRVVLDRDGSVIPAGDDERGMSFEQAALQKASERYPVGSVMRENLEKAAATSAIKEIMVARSQA